MILTEEQRAAIRAVSGLLTAIGCPQCHSYLQKNYTHHIEVLRAMTDSSEHFSDATKMIGFDMEKAREVAAFMQTYHHYGWERFYEALEEIEQMRAENKIIADRAAHNAKQDAASAKLQAARIEELKGDLETAKSSLKYDREEIARLRADSEQYERVIEARLDVIDQQAARIKELEADNQNLVTLNKSLMNNDWILRDNNRKYRKRAQKAEFLNKELKSKIGPDAKPHCWQITEERKAAIRDAEIALRDAVLDSNDPHCWDAETAVLRAMLTEAGQ